MGNRGAFRQGVRHRGAHRASISLCAFQSQKGVTLVFAGEGRQLVNEGVLSNSEARKGSCRAHRETVLFKQLPHVRALGEFRTQIATQGVVLRQAFGLREPEVTPIAAQGIQHAEFVGAERKVGFRIAQIKVCGNCLEAAVRGAAGCRACDFSAMPLKKGAR